MTGGNPLTDEELLLDSEAWEGDEDLFLPDSTAEVERLDAAAISYLQHADSSPLYEHFRVVADKGQAPMRIDKYLATRMTGSSRSRIQQALDGGYVFVGDKPVKSNYRIKPLDVVTLQLRRPKHELEIIPEPIPLDVVYEDEVLMVVNKPAGLVVHPGHGNYTGTLVNALAYYLQDDPLYDPADPNVGLVHRIDKDTSGLLVIAKRPEAKAHLARQFFNKTTRRTYRALVWGRLKEAEARSSATSAVTSVTAYRWRSIPRALPRVSTLSRTTPSSRSWPTSAGSNADSRRDARTRSAPTCATSGTRSSLMHAMVATRSFGGNQFSRYKQFVQNCLTLCPRQALHAKTLGFVHPVTGEEMLFDSELPSDLQQLLERWRTYAAQVDNE